jgi:phage terminase large subunit-like protein
MTDLTPEQWEAMSPSAQAEYCRQLEAQLQVQTYNKLVFFQPYPKQKEFFTLSSEKQERCLMAGNQLGKTMAGGFEMAVHLTGLYPDWWEGRKFDHPIRAWACAETGELIRDILQAKLIGEGAYGPDHPAWGTGFIPREMLISRSLAHGTTGAFDSVQVRHVSGGISNLGFKAYAQGRQKFASATLHVVWGDEEPPMDVYTEIMARITATRGMMSLTFTALLGPTEVTNRFVNDDTAEAKKHRGLVVMGLTDCAHITPQMVEEMKARYPSHQWDARLYGGVLMGEGGVWEGIDINSLIVPEIPLADIPPFYRKIWGIDFGIGHPFGAILAVHDVDVDTIRIVREIKVANKLPADHIVAMRSIAPTVPVAWPHDGASRQQGTGVQLYKYYQGTPAQPGLVMRPTHAAFPLNNYATEAGVLDILARMREGRFEVAANCTKWLEEARSYHRKNGLIVKLNDDLMSATRQAVMDIRYAKSIHPLSPFARSQQARPRQAGPTDPWTNKPLR